MCSVLSIALAALAAGVGLLLGVIAAMLLWAVFK